MQDRKHNKEVREGGGGGTNVRITYTKREELLGNTTAWPVTVKSILTCNYNESVCEVIAGHELGVCWHPQTGINTHSRGHCWWRIPGGKTRTTTDSGEGRSDAAFPSLPTRKVIKVSQLSTSHRGVTVDMKGPPNTPTRVYIILEHQNCGWLKWQERAVLQDFIAKATNNRQIQAKVMTAEHHQESNWCQKLIVC